MFPSLSHVKQRVSILFLLPPRSSPDPASDAAFDAEAMICRAQLLTGTPTTQGATGKKKSCAKDGLEVW